MITEHDLDEAIAECKGKRSPVASDCIKLAAFYTIKENMYPKDPGHVSGRDPVSAFAFSPGPAIDQNVVSVSGRSEFLQAVNGKKIDDLLPVFDEIMQTLQVIQPRLYNGIINKLSQL